MITKVLKNALLNCIKIIASASIITQKHLNNLYMVIYGNIIFCHYNRIITVNHIIHVIVLTSNFFLHAIIR